MTSSAIQRIPVPVREITGRPGQSWGYVVVPTSGKVTMRILSDMLETSIATAYGLEQREIHTRIQRIETVEMVEGRLWWLLIIGIPLLFVFFLGVIPIVLFFVLKQKWLVVHNASGNLTLFYKDSKKVQDFCRTLMAISRQLNSKSSSSAPPANGNRPQSANDQRPRVAKPMSQA
jgi:hypothetical protein